VARYAPVIFQETTAENRHWDYLCAIDFDGDWNTENNMKNLESDTEGKSLKATVYYSLIESKTHFIILYSIFHPLEWSREKEDLTRWYENDIKNVQVVVKKQSRNSSEGQIWMLAIQRSSGIDFYKTAEAYVKERRVKFQNFKLLFADSQGEPSPEGTHPILIMTSGHHNVFVPKERPEYFENIGDWQSRPGVLYVPSQSLSEGEVSGKKDTPRTQYALVDIAELLWDTSEAKPHNASFQRPFFDYADEQISFEDVPVWLKGESLEGVRTHSENPNIVPFAFGKHLGKNSQGTFFFNPIAAYQTYFFVYGWSLHYIYHPYASGVPKHK
jgi:hypothetical protein